MIADLSVHKGKRDTSLLAKTLKIVLRRFRYDFPVFQKSIFFVKGKILLTDEKEMIFQFETLPLEWVDSIFGQQKGDLLRAKETYPARESDSTSSLNGYLRLSRSFGSMHKPYRKTTEGARTIAYTEGTPSRRFANRSLHSRTVSSVYRNMKRKQSDGMS